MELQRRVGVARATGIGLSAMIGAGLFVAFGPASRAAGDALLGALALASAVAACNAISSARLARRHPSSGGTYVFGRERLGPAWGHLAGWVFLCGKTASCAAMALAVGLHLAPEHARTAAVLVVAALTALNLLGVHRSADVAIVSTALVLAIVLAAVAVLVGAAPVASAAPPGGTSGMLAGAGLLFFAFAGYARLATLGEEVRDPERTIGVAVAVSFTVVIALYAAVAVAVTRVLPHDALVGSGRPIVDALDAVGHPGLGRAVAVVGVLAAGGALLSLLLGISRTALAMARDGRLPGALARTNEHSVPWVAELAVAVVVVLALPFAGLGTAIAVSSGSVLVYYAITNAAALTLGGHPGLRAVAVLGLVGCLVVVAALPPTVVAATIVLVLLGLLTARLRPFPRAT